MSYQTAPMEDVILQRGEHLATRFEAHCPLPDDTPFSEEALSDEGFVDFKKMWVRIREIERRARRKK